MNNEVKACFSCSLIKPVSSFHKKSKAKDGLSCWCKPCTKLKSAKSYLNNREKAIARVTTYRNNNMDKIKEKDRCRWMNNKSRREAHLIANVSYNLRNPVKSHARSMLNHAIVSGAINRLPCEKCGSIENIHGHHEDYSKPLNVVWLCVTHHGERHREINKNTARH